MELSPFVFRHEGALVGQRGLESSPDVIDEVNRFSLRPLGAEDVAVFTLDLCHNEVDRHFSRFPDDELSRINEMVPGRPLMERHDLRGSLPRGTFFRSDLHAEGSRTSVRPDVYVLRTGENSDFIRNIEGGVYRETSIGFSFQTPECSVCQRDLRTCDHIPGRSYGDECCHFVMRDVREVIEGSIVPAGSQGTGFISAESGETRFRDQVRALPVVEALAAARDVVHTPIVLRGSETWAEE